MSAKTFAIGAINGLLGAGLALAAPSLSQAADVASAPAGTPLMEIIVTAQKREEKLQDVPVPVSVIEAEALLSNNQTTIQDFYARVPGLSVAPDTVGANQSPAIRGLTTGRGTSTTGIMVDGVPYGAVGAARVPELDPADLQRVEVLRGPQGTLYGSSSMGGLINYITTDPSSAGTSGRLEAGTESVDNGYSLGYVFRGSVNLPVGDTLAVRVSAFTRQDPGYLDNPLLHIDGINEGHATGGHLAILWQPTDSFSAKISALYQDSRVNSTNDETTTDFNGLPVNGTFQQAYIRDWSFNDLKSEIFSAVLTGRIGSATLTSITGENNAHADNSFDATTALAGLPPVFPAFPGYIGFPAANPIRTSRFSEELHLSAPLGQRFDGTLGAYYTHSDATATENILATEPYTGAVAGLAYQNVAPGTYAETAGFVNLTYHVTDRLDIQIGGRESHLEIDAKTQTNSGPLAGPIFGLPPTVPGNSATNNVFTYLFTPELKISPDAMVYARLASGFRPGGSNAGAIGAPPAYDADKTKTYEIGSKGAILNKTVSFDASVYYIDWQQIQVTLANQFGTYQANAGSAKSQGVELSVETNPVKGLNISGWAAYNDAELTSVPANIFPPRTFFEGDRLPYSARISGEISAEERFPIANRVTGFVAVTELYQGWRKGLFVNFGGPDARQVYPGYARTDLRAGVDYDQWTVNVYGNNVTNKRALISGGAGFSFPFSLYYIEPRVIGLSVSLRF